MNLRHLFSLLLMSLFISGLSLYLLISGRAGMGPHLLVLFLLYHWGPGLSALLLHWVMDRGELSVLGLRSGRLSWRWLGTAALTPVALVLATAAVVYVAGNLLHIPGFGYLDLQQAHPESFAPGSGANRFGLFGLLSAWASPWLPLSSQGLQSFWLMLLLGVVAGCTFQIPFLLGQELGWRGFAQHHSQALGWLGSSMVTGAIWGIWSLLPFLFIPEAFEWQALLLIPGICIALSALASYAALKSGSVLGATLLTGVWGGASAALSLLIAEADPWKGSAQGIAGIMALVLAAGLIQFFDPEWVNRFPQLRYGPEEKNKEN